MQNFKWPNLQSLIQFIKSELTPEDQKWEEELYDWPT